MKYLEQITVFLNKILLIVGGIAVLALMSLATGNVVLRIFHMPFRGAYEIVSFLGAIVIAFALGYTQKSKGPHRSGYSYGKIPKKTSASMFDTLADLVITDFFRNGFLADILSGE